MHQGPQTRHGASLADESTRTDAKFRHGWASKNQQVIGGREALGPCRVGQVLRAVAVAALRKQHRHSATLARYPDTTRGIAPYKNFWRLRCGWLAGGVGGANHL